MTKKISYECIQTTEQREYAVDATGSGLEQLPFEAKQVILSAFTDVSSLKAAALTCSSLYHALKNAEELTITEVLLSEIDRPQSQKIR